MDVAEFLRGVPPFDSLPADRLARVALAAITRDFDSGTVVLRQGGDPSSFLYVVVDGTVEIDDVTQAIDVLTQGDLFGAWSLLGGFSPTATVRARDRVTCLLFPREAAAEALTTSKGMASLASTFRRRIERVEQARPFDADPVWRRPAAEILRRPPVICEPRASVGEAAELMSRERVSSVLVPIGETWGILTDRDLRNRVLGRRRGPEMPVSEAMTVPAETVAAEAMAGEVLLWMLERAVHHAPVVESNGRLVGVITDTDLMGPANTPFALQHAIGRAEDRQAVVTTGRRLPGLVSTLVEADVDPVDIGHIVALTIDAMTRRLVELASGELGDPPVPWAWLALGSAARQEQALVTDQDHALAYDPGDGTEDEVDPHFAALAEQVTSDLEAAGIPRCKGNAMATTRELRHGVEGWIDVYRSWIRDPGIKGSEMLSIVFDYRRVIGALDVEAPLDALVREAAERPTFVRHLAHRALDLRPPTRLLGGFRLESKGEHAGRFDIKHGGITIIGNLARAAAIGAGLSEKRTIARLRAAAYSDAIPEDEAGELEEAFRFLWGVRLRHQAEQHRSGMEPDDFVGPDELGPVARQGAKEALRAIARAQRGMAGRLGIALRWRGLSPDRLSSLDRAAPAPPPSRGTHRRHGRSRP